ncbi:hypothetical protein QAD02_005631, partial [Eretmocerus hayati]
MRNDRFAATAIALLFLSQFQPPTASSGRMVVGRAAASSVVGSAVCARIPGLGKLQREICRKSPHTMPILSEGAELGLRECQHQFRHHRWNCSHVVEDNQIFGHIVAV